MKNPFKSKDEPVKPERFSDIDDAVAVLQKALKDGRILTSQGSNNTGALIVTATDMRLAYLYQSGIDNKLDHAMFRAEFGAPKIISGTEANKAELERLERNIATNRQMMDKQAETLARDSVAAAELRATLGVKS